MLSALAVMFGIVGFAAALRGGALLMDAAVVAIASAGALVVSARFGWLGGASAFAGRLAAMVARTPARLRIKAAGAFRVAAASISADVTIAPALIQTPLSPSDAVSRARFASQAALAPGAMPVALRDGFALVHVLDEDRHDAGGTGRRAGASS